LRIGVAPDCGGPVSPDGRFELHGESGRLTMLELATGVRTPLGGDFRFAPLGNEWATWSPDGKWIAAVLTGMPGADSVVVISAKSPALARRLGRAEGAPA